MVYSTCTPTPIEDEAEGQPPSLGFSTFSTLSLHCKLAVAWCTRRARPTRLKMRPWLQSCWCAAREPCSHLTKDLSLSQQLSPLSCSMHLASILRLFSDTLCIIPYTLCIAGWWPHGVLHMHA
jgi:hypothetical protein